MDPMGVGGIWHAQASQLCQWLMKEMALTSDFEASIGSNEKSSEVSFVGFVGCHGFNEKKVLKKKVMWIVLSNKIVGFGVAVACFLGGYLFFLPLKQHMKGWLFAVDGKV